VVAHAIGRHRVIGGDLLVAPVDDSSHLACRAGRRRGGARDVHTDASSSNRSRRPLQIA
jgi:hypothetical protein